MNAVEWFKHRSYDYRQFSDLEALSRRKRDLSLTVSAVLPCRNVADTVGGIVDEIHAVNRLTGDHPLVDQILAVDADSPDGTAEVAASKGAEVYSENEPMRLESALSGRRGELTSSKGLLDGTSMINAQLEDAESLLSSLRGELLALDTSLSPGSLETGLAQLKSRVVYFRQSIDEVTRSVETLPATTERLLAR